MHYFLNHAAAARNHGHVDMNYADYMPWYLPEIREQMVLPAEDTHHFRHYLAAARNHGHVDMYHADHVLRHGFSQKYVSRWSCVP